MNDICQSERAEEELRTQVAVKQCSLHNQNVLSLGNHPIYVFILSNAEVILNKKCQVQTGGSEPVAVLRFLAESNIHPAHVRPEKCVADVQIK